MKGPAVIRNIGTSERALRIVVGLVMLGSPLAWYGPENINPWGYIGLIPFLTGLTGSCPLYRALGWKTN
jgi:Protein of unknown function (DUF2892)